ncbi:MAG: hypothetical protein NVSMB33_08460 [Ktedonobacteraceae bacterium]
MVEKRDTLHLAGELSVTMNEEQSKKREPQQSQHIYIPATVDAPADFLLHMIRFPIAAKEAPDQICGTAQRVGHVQFSGSKQAVYRLKLRMSFASRKTATIPGFFVLTNGMFVRYDNTDAENIQDKQ